MEEMKIVKNHKHIRMFMWPCRLLAVGVLYFGWMVLQDQWRHDYKINNQSIAIVFYAVVLAWLVAKIPAVIEWIRSRSSYKLTEFGIEKTWRLLLILNEQTITIPYKHIRLITTLKRDTDYIFKKDGIGSLFLDCAGTAQPEIRMWSIENAAAIKNVIEQRMSGKEEPAKKIGE